MEIIKKVKKALFAAAWVKGKITTIIGLIILLRWSIVYIANGEFVFSDDVPMLIFGAFLFTIKDPEFLKTLMQKLL